MGSTDEAGEMPPVVIDLKKQRSKRIKDLKRGRGKLMEDVYAAVEEVRESLGAGAAGKQIIPVVIIYERKRKKRGRGLGLPLPFGKF
jgi:hypothetical protein